MNITINNISTQVYAANVEQLVAELALPQRGVAIAVGSTVVPRGEWPVTVLNEGDRVTVIKAAFGG